MLLIGTLRWQCLSEYYLKFWLPLRVVSELLWNQLCDENGGPHQKHDIPNKLDGFQQNDGFSYFRVLNEAISRGFLYPFQVIDDEFVANLNVLKATSRIFFWNKVSIPPKSWRTGYKLEQYNLT